MTKKNILLTGGAGFIGSHTAVVLLSAGHSVTVIDSMANSHEKVFERITEISGESPKVYRGDIRDEELVSEALRENSIDVVVHFAGLKAVGESLVIPLEYYSNNVTGTISLLNAMESNGVKKLIFSSSATVYGSDASTPYKEDCRGTLESIPNPYGRTKFIVEHLLEDFTKANPDWRVALLRYFNPVGAHPSGLIGENPLGTPNNLMPFVSQVAVGRVPQLTVFGDDYPTKDGTCERDYIHVMDLAEGHLQAALYLDEATTPCQAINLGTGTPVSVLELIRAFEAESGRTIPTVMGPRRGGDLASTYACPEKAAQLLNWRTKYSVQEMCRDSWKWQSLNPAGYE